MFGTKNGHIVALIPLRNGRFLGTSENMSSKISVGRRLIGRIPFRSLRTTDVALRSDVSRTPNCSFPLSTTQTFGDELRAGLAISWTLSPLQHKSANMFTVRNDQRHSHPCLSGFKLLCDAQQQRPRRAQVIQSEVLRIGQDFHPMGVHVSQSRHVRAAPSGVCCRWSSHEF